MVRASPAREVASLATDTKKTRVPEDTMKPGMKGVHIHDMQGTWSVYESRILDGAGYYRMEREGSMENNFVILDEKGDVVAKDVASFEGKVIQINLREKSLTNTSLSNHGVYRWGEREFQEHEEVSGDAARRTDG